MASVPGTRFAYSNVGYVLLGALVEKLYGKPYGATLHEEIALPLGLRTLGWCTEPKDSTATTGYSYDGPGRLLPFPYAHPSLSPGAGALCHGAGCGRVEPGAARGAGALAGLLRRHHHPPRAAPRYGFGLQVNPTPWGAPAIYHLGAVTGFAAENAWFPRNRSP